MITISYFDKGNEIINKNNLYKNLNQQNIKLKNTLINFYGNQNNVSKATNIFKSIKLVLMQ